MVKKDKKEPLKITFERLFSPETVEYCEDALYTVFYMKEEKSPGTGMEEETHQWASRKKQEASRHMIP